MPPATGAAVSTYRFADVAVQAGLAEPTVTWGATWNDYDSDGYADLWVGRHVREPWLFHNNLGQSFERAHADDFPLMDRHACAWGEANGDGRADLYCAQGAVQGTGQGPNQLFIRTASGFDERARAFGVQDRFGRGRSVNWIDYDSDGDLDIIVGNQRRAGFPNVTFRNDGGDGFTEVDIGLRQELNSTASSWADWDRDGDPDLLLMESGGFPLAYENVDGVFRRTDLGQVFQSSWRSGAWGDYDGDGWVDLHLIGTNESVILHNVEGTFVVAHRLDLRIGRMSTWIDVDNDGDLDSFIVQGNPNLPVGVPSTNYPDLLLVSRPDGFVAARDPSFRGPSDGNADMATITDYDRDGKQDVFVTNGNRRNFGTNELLRNLTTAGNSIGIDLRGGERNPLGIGAFLRVTSASASYRRQLTDAVVWKAQSEVGYVHLGTGGAPSAHVRVRWPGKRVDCITVAAGRIVALTAGDKPCP